MFIPHGSIEKHNSLIQCFNTRSIPEPPTKYLDMHYIFKLACENENDEMAIWTFDGSFKFLSDEKLHESPNEHRRYNEMFLWHACETSRTVVVDYILNAYDLWKHNPDTDTIVEIACEYGNDEILKLLYARYTDKLNIHEDDDYGFSYACANGHINTVKLLFQIAEELKSPIDIHVFDDWTFSYTCGNGHIEIVRYLYEKSIELNVPIYVNTDNDTPFILACENGQLSIVKWLLEKSVEQNTQIDIRVENDKPFRLACENGHIDVAKFLSTFDDGYIIETTDTTDITNDKIKWKIVDHLSDTSLTELDQNTTLRKPIDDDSIECCVCNETRDECGDSLYILPCSTNESKHVVCGMCISYLRTRTNIKCPHCTRIVGLYHLYGESM
jgi:hypothetical protein